jgi:hypothetical protein
LGSAGARRHGGVPGWLEHSVAPFQGDGVRICIAFNVKLLTA